MLVTELFRSIAIDETDVSSPHFIFVNFSIFQIERLRQELAQIRDFDPRVLFERIDERNKDSKITPKELLDFLQDNYMKHITLEDCQEIVKEFDSSLDGCLNYDEFLNIFLPAANANLRQYCLYHKQVASYYTSNKRPLPVSVTSMAVRILEKEKTLANRRNEIKRDLFKHKDH